MEHVGEAAVIGFGAGRPETPAWIKAASDAALEEGVAALLTKIHETIRSMRSPAKRKAMTKLEQYVANHAPPNGTQRSTSMRFTSIEIHRGRTDGPNRP